MSARTAVAHMNAADYLRHELQAEEQECRRYRIAWHQARQRAADHLAALVEADAERDHLAVQLRERDEELRDLATRLAQYCGITS